MIKKKTISYFIYIILIAMAIAPAFALGEGNRNLFLIGVMGFSPIIILHYGRFDRLNKKLLFFILSVVLFPLINQPQSMRWSTVLYSIMFCITFMAYQELLNQRYFTPIKYLKLLRSLILAYFVVLIIQQLCVLIGIPIFNLSNYDVNDPWKLNALSAEPSHSARIVALLMFCYITIKELVTNRKYSFAQDLKKDKWVWIAFTWTMITMGSSTAFLFLIIVLLKFLRFKKLVPFFIIGIAFIFTLDFLEIKTFDRTKNVFIATLTLNEEAILQADHSAAMRIVPGMVVAKKVGVSSIDDWLGHGVDYSASFISDEIRGLPEGASGGGMFQIWLEYGLIAFIFFVLFSLSKTYRKSDYLSLFFWFFLVFIYGVNNQIVWLCIVLLYTNKYFYNNNLNLKQKISMSKNEENLNFQQL